MSIKTNTKSVIKALESKGKKGIEEIQIATYANAKDIELNAKANAPIDNGDLKKSITTQKLDKKGFAYRILVGMLYGAYQEFGTGKKVDLSYLVQAGFSKSEALKYKGKGIKEVNIMPQPYLFPAFIKGKTQYIKDLKTALKRLTK